MSTARTEGFMILSRLPFIICLFFSGILSGLFAMGTIVIQPVSVRLPTEAQILFRQQMISRLHYLAQFLMLGAFFSSVFTAIFSSLGWSRALLLFNVAMFGLSILITLLGNVPLNHRFMEWQLNAPPGNWTKLVRKWALYDKIRFGLCLLSFSLALVAWSLTETTR